MNHNMPDYFHTLTPEQRLHDCIHNLALRLKIPHKEAWRIFEREYNRAFNVHLATLRDEYQLKNGTMPTIPAHLNYIGHIRQAVDFALSL